MQMFTNLQESFIQLVRLGIGISRTDVAAITDRVDWTQMKALADAQGLTAVVLDGLSEMRNRRINLFGHKDDVREQWLPSHELMLQWIGQVQYWENVTAAQQKSAEKMAELFYKNNIGTYVLKGRVVSECYPIPSHRVSVDMDCFLRKVNEEGCLIQDSHEEAWTYGNELIEAEGYKVQRDFYKNSKYQLQNLTVENHRYLTPFRGNKTLMMLETVLQMMMNNDKGEDRFEGTMLYRPPVMVSTLFLIEHAYSHFLHEGLTWKMVLDWMMFRKKHQSEIDWNVFNARIDEFGFRRFFDSYNRLGLYLVDELNYDNLTFRDILMLNDIWADLDVHETVRGWKGKLHLAGNTWRARWKYHYFSELSMFQALWIQTKGFLFDKHPELN